MNIVINAVLYHSQPRGVGRYINNLLPGLAEADKENEYYIYYGKWMNEYSFLKIDQSNFHFIELDISNSLIKRNWFLAYKLPKLCKKYNPDVLFLVDTQAILKKPCKIVSTIHDLAEFEVNTKYSKLKAFIRRKIVKKQVKLSDKIITVSEYSKSSLIKHFNLKEDKIKVIYNSVDLNKFTSEKNEYQNYFLFVSEIERAKNLLCVLKSFTNLKAEYKNNFKIEVVGNKGNDYENILKFIKDNNLIHCVNINGYVNDKELSQLYKQAYAFIFPSYFEGFGLPVLEAMASGVPVICSNSSSIPEVGGDAVLTFNPNDHEELTEQMEKIISDKQLRATMIERGLERARNKAFTQEEIVKNTLKILTGLN